MTMIVVIIICSSEDLRYFLSKDNSYETAINYVFYISMVIIKNAMTVTDPSHAFSQSNKGSHELQLGFIIITILYGSTSPRSATFSFD